LLAFFQNFLVKSNAICYIQYTDAKRDGCRGSKDTTPLQTSVLFFANGARSRTRLRVHDRSSEDIEGRKLFIAQDQALQSID